MSLKRVAVVTGGAGFIGSHMVEHLLDRHFEVRAIDNLSTGREANLDEFKNSPDLRLDTRDLRQLSSQDSFFKGVDYVFHFAGRGDIVPSIDHPTEYISCNLMGTVHALECSRHFKAKKFIYAASSSCYGLAKELPTTETAAVLPEHPYALSKYLGENATFHWGQVYHLPVNSIRMFNVYGTKARTTGAYGAVFGVFLRQKIADKPFTVVGDGTQTRDFVYASDVARAFLMVAESSHVNQIYNLGAGKPQSVNRLVEVLGGKEVVHVPKRPGEPDCTWADISKIKSHIGWEPKITFEEGASKMLARIDYWRDAPLWDAKSIHEATEGWFHAFGGINDNDARNQKLKL